MQDVHRRFTKSKSKYCIKLTVADMQENQPLLGSTSYGFNHSTALRNLNVTQERELSPEALCCIVLQ